MSSSTTIQLTRREFVAASGVFTGALMMPPALLAAPPSSSVAGTTLSPGYASGVRCEFEYCAGIMRPRAWQLANGASLELVQSSNRGCVDIRFVSPVAGHEYFYADHLQFGRPQEIIRQSFGDDVLCQVIEAVDRRRRAEV